MEELLCIDSNGTLSRDPPTGRIALFPGSFDPLHAGHRRLAAVAEAKFGLPVHYELSLTNVDKPDLAAEVWKARAAQFAGVAPLWLTRAPTFEAKSLLFPGALFVVGYDTVLRLLDAKYYADETDRRRSLEAICERGCRFAVGGRLDGAGAFRTWSDSLLSPAGSLPPVFDMLSEADFRLDLSSTELREASGAGYNLQSHPHPGGASCPVSSPSSPR